MLEIASKLSAIVKDLILPLLVVTAVHSTKSHIKEERTLGMEDQAPGDNFPHIVRS